MEEIQTDEVSKLVVEAQDRVENRWVGQILKNKTTPFQEIKENLRMARKPKMRTVQLLQCDACDKVIMEPEDGFIVQGNIYVADPANRGGLIGNNIPLNGGVEEIQESAFCKRCFIKALHLDKTSSAIWDSQKKKEQF